MNHDHGADRHLTSSWLICDNTPLGPTSLDQATDLTVLRGGKRRWLPLSQVQAGGSLLTSTGRASRWSTRSADIIDSIDYAAREAYPDNTIAQDCADWPVKLTLDDANDIEVCRAPACCPQHSCVDTKKANYFATRSFHSR